MASLHRDLLEQTRGFPRSRRRSRLRAWVRRWEFELVLLALYAGLVAVLLFAMVAGVR